MPEHYFQQLVLTEDYALLEPCGLVIECTIEDIAIKIRLRKIEAVVSTNAIVTSNTSAIPISMLQQETKHPERFLGCIGPSPRILPGFLKLSVVQK